ncbi:hypothetical protein FDP41_013482 [Naegleria fowleri]|uniref:Zn(2)-C6 fungal-type domain-containing protein n=1 Tax=Naegleria fowleri TaxID=5763 RepID=A0A6A5C322_NAEFO|nr:uncharacterized protein FDP41_013482 [Naegleria fowleri]KAF0980268.1 hypothetical protein FDP41_013482 [Naegleria fowleri]
MTTSFPNTSMSPTFSTLNKACLSCRLSHKACDRQRPCSRCVRRGCPQQCCDTPERKRGRPRKWTSEKNQEEELGSNDAITTTTTTTTASPSLHIELDNSLTGTNSGHNTFCCSSSSSIMNEFASAPASVSSSTTTLPSCVLSKPHNHVAIKKKNHETGLVRKRKNIKIMNYNPNHKESMSAKFCVLNSPSCEKKNKQHNTRTCASTTSSMVKRLLEQDKLLVPLSAMHPLSIKENNRNSGFSETREQPVRKEGQGTQTVSTGCNNNQPYTSLPSYVSHYCNYYHFDMTTCYSSSVVPFHQQQSPHLKHTAQTHGPQNPKLPLTAPHPNQSPLISFNSPQEAFASNSSSLVDINRSHGISSDCMIPPIPTFHHHHRIGGLTSVTPHPSTHQYLNVNWNSQTNSAHSPKTESSDPHQQQQSPPQSVTLPSIKTLLSFVTLDQ